MTEEEMTLYTEAMRKGLYIAAASIVLGAKWHEEERERAERERESREFWAAWKKRKEAEASNA